MNIVTTCLYRLLDNDIYMKLFKDFKVPEENNSKPCNIYSIKPQRSLYGLK